MQYTLPAESRTGYPDRPNLDWEGFYWRELELASPYPSRPNADMKADARERATVLVDIERVIQQRQMFRHDAYRACGLPEQAFDDGSLSTEALRVALAALRALPRE